METLKQHRRPSWLQRIGFQRIGLQRAWFRWIDKRTPLASSITLNRRNLYIFPNRQGALLLLIIGVIWLLGTNYQNNLMLGVSYLLISLWIVTIYHTYANLAGVQVRFIHTEPGFAGDDIAFTLQLECTHKHGSQRIELHWPNGEPSIASITPNEPTQVKLWAPSSARGYLRPGRLHLKSHFPLGIIHCWTWLNLDARALVYPQPVPCTEPQAQYQGGREEGSRAVAGGDDYHGLRPYHPGDPIKHIAWKPYAQEKGLFLKEYQHPLSAEKWLAWDSLALAQELRLSGLCYWALEYEQRHIAYGLALPGVHIEPALGDAHREAVLAALAHFNPPQPTAEAGHAPAP